MPHPPEDPIPSTSEREPLLIDFGGVEFPSDVLSVKRLRQIFPEHFEQGTLTDGYGFFFFPLAHDDPPHLSRLSDLLSAERQLADYAFYNTIDPYPSETLDEECRWCADEARKKLEPLYQEFKLADSPETARFLIKLVEEQGVKQGEQVMSRTK